MTREGAMQPENAIAVPDLKPFYERAGGEVAFATILDGLDIADDYFLAELIEADGRLRLERGLTVDLTRYLHAEKTLVDRKVPLDAAIDLALRSASGGLGITLAAITRLIQRHPEMEITIREATTLDAAVWSTTRVRQRGSAPPVKPVPMDFGPTLASGERRYLLQKFLGQGAFGQVYLALDRQLSEEGHTALVAIKILVAADRSTWDRQRLI